MRGGKRRSRRAAGRLRHQCRCALVAASLGVALLGCGNDRLAGSVPRATEATATTTQTPRVLASVLATPPPELSPFLDPELLPREINAVMLRSVTFEDGEAPGEEDSQSQAESQVVAEFQQAVNEGLRATSATARLGDMAGEALLRPDDPQYRNRLGYRAEWQSEFHADRDTEYWYSASYYLPEDWDQGKNRSFNDRIIFQFHEGTAGSPVFSLHLTDESEFMLRRKRPDDRFEYLWRRPFETERWYDFVFHAKWTKDDDGFFRIYFNQQLVHDYRGRTLADGSTVYTKWGVYGQPTHVLFDEVRIVEGEGGLRLASPWPLVLR